VPYGSEKRLKRTRIRPISDKQKEELQRRRELKDYLILKYGRICRTCGASPWFPPLALSHIIPLSRGKAAGGVTSEENCLIECDTCHRKYEKHPELRGQI
jgi:5-methylcytosine-specific restriction endonuclease McrA